MSTYRDDIYARNQAIVSAVTTKAMTVDQACRHFNVSRATVYRICRRYELEGPETLYPQSKRPHTTPDKISTQLQEQIITIHDDLTAKGLDSGPSSVHAVLAQDMDNPPHVATIYRYLRTAGRTAQQPHKRPRNSWIRFEGAMPNSLWQSDFTHVRLADNTDVEIIAWLDDHSRYLLHISAHKRVTGKTVIDTFETTCYRHGPPAATLTDNGMVYTTRTARGGQTGPNGFENILAELGIEQRNGKPNHPTTQGKIERFWQTLKKWLSARPRATTIAELNTLLKQFREIYNKERPHQAIGRRTPHSVYLATAKDNPGLHRDPHTRYRIDKVDSAGKVTLRHLGKQLYLGVGRAHKGSPVWIVVHGETAFVVHRKTKEILGEYILKITRNYQPKQPPGTVTKKD